MELMRFWGEAGGRGLWRFWGRPEADSEDLTRGGGGQEAAHEILGEARRQGAHEILGEARGRRLSRPGGGPRQ